MEQQDVHLFVFNGLSDWEAGYAIAGINNPQFQKHPGRYRMRTIALKKAPISTAGGVRVVPDLPLDALSAADGAMLILPGGAAWDEGKHAEVVELARSFLDSGKLVAAICGATAGMARGGLLDSRRHTSNAREYLAATNYNGGTLYEEAPSVTDNHLITASAMAPVDFACHIFRALDVYAPPILEAWYGLFKTGRAEYFGALMNAVNP